MRNIKILLLSMISFIGLSGCNDYLELYPDNAQTLDQYWNSKSDVESVIAAGYFELREGVRHIFIWGEARGNSIYFNALTNKDVLEATQIRELTMTNSNTYLKWERMYKVINMANSVLQYAPNVRDVDPSFTTEEMNGYFSEAYFLRSLAYFYLVRTFGDVPFITMPYVDDNESFELAKSDGDEILQEIKKDLLKAIPSGKEYYPEVGNSKANTKGRATKWSIYALLADIYLWEGDYDSCISYCDLLINSGNFGLSSNKNWFTNYYPGNTNESIFEIQYDYSKNQTNSFFSWFGGNNYYLASDYTIQSFIQSTLYGDIRGLGATYYTVNGYRAFWKYIGKDFADNSLEVRGSTDFDQNFIIYRLSEIFLMRAEAYIMKGNGNYAKAMEDIGFIRTQRGVVENLSTLSTEIEMLTFLYDERIRELSGEGKSWFDLLRIAKRNNYQYREFMISRVLTTVSPGLYGVIRSKLNNNGSHYLPIHKDELVSNGLLEQSSYYKSLGF